MEPRRVVITGLGMATPLGIDPEGIWSALLENRSGIRRIDAFDPSRFRSQVGGSVSKLSMGDFIPKHYRKNAKVMCRDIQLALVAAYQAIRDSGLVTRCLVERKESDSPGTLDPTRFGANIGAGLICADIEELTSALSTAMGDSGQFDIERWGREGMENLTPLWLLKFLPNMLACHVTIVHDAQAPSNTVTCGEASSHLAIGEAFRTIQRGGADVCICGGAESRVNCMGLLRQDLFGRLASEYNDCPERACRPFDRTHAGTVVSEGGGLLILESLDHAQKRGARIYGEIVGMGASCNTHSWKDADPTGRCIALAILKAMSDGGITAEQVNLVTAFGTGIPSFDRSEAAAIREVFGTHGSPRVMAIKGAMGNNGAGSGAIDLAISVLSMKHNTIPAACSTSELADECKIPLVMGQPVDARIDYLVSTAYALSGGQTAALVIKKFSA